MQVDLRGSENQTLCRPSALFISLVRGGNLRGKPGFGPVPRERLRKDQPELGHRTIQVLLVGRFVWLSLPGKSASRERGTSDLVSCQRPPVISANCACGTTPLVV